MSELTVLMTVYNGEKYLEEALDSILKQTFQDFNFLILDNASTDSSRDIIFSRKDPRIQLIALPENIGQVAALNKGINLINTPYIARMDADDISLPRRLERQMEFMKKNSHIGVCGTDVIMFREEKQFLKHYPSESEDIKARLIFGCYLAHPSVIIRKGFFDRFQLRFDEKIGHSEDWELWQRASFCFPLANIPEKHLLYRLHPESVSSVNEKRKRQAAQAIYNRYFELLGLLDAAERFVHMDAAAATFNATGREYRFIEQVMTWLDKLREANKARSIFDFFSFENALKETLFTVVKANSHLGRSARWLFFRSRLYHGKSMKEVFQFLIKSMVGSEK